MNKKIDQLAVNNIRALCISMVEKANSGHPGGPMGGADFMHILYSEFLNFDPSDMSWEFRDRFFMDAGHLSTLLYAQYYLFNNYSKDDIELYSFILDCIKEYSLEKLDYSYFSNEYKNAIFNLKELKSDNLLLNQKRRSTVVLQWSRAEFVQLSLVKQIQSYFYLKK
mgnify:CR=1 FL=1